MKDIGIRYKGYKIVENDSEVRGGTGQIEPPILSPVLSEYLAWATFHKICNLR